MAKVEAAESKAMTTVTMQLGKIIKTVIAKGANAKSVDDLRTIW